MDINVQKFMNGRFYYYNKTERMEFSTILKGYMREIEYIENKDTDYTYNLLAYRAKKQQERSTSTVQYNQVCLNIPKCIREYDDFSVAYDIDLVNNSKGIRVECTNDMYRYRFLIPYNFLLSVNKAIAMRWDLNDLQDDTVVNIICNTIQNQNAQEQQGSSKLDNLFIILEHEGELTWNESITAEVDNDFELTQLQAIVSQDRKTKKILENLSKVYSAINKESSVKLILTLGKLDIIDPNIYQTIKELDLSRITLS